MSAYKDETTAKRMQSAGDIAEKQFEAWATAHGIEWYRYGLHGKAPWSGSDFIQATPDYLTRIEFFEVQGVGQDRLVKIKDKKVKALVRWQSVSGHKVTFWFFDAVQRAWTTEPLWMVYQWLEDSGINGTYPEGSAWRGIPVTSLLWEPVTTWVDSDWHREG